MDCADDEFGTPVEAEDLTEENRQGPFFCPSCGIDVLAAAVPVRSAPPPRRPAHFRRYPGTSHLMPDCRGRDETTKLIVGSRNVDRPDGKPESFPTVVVFARVSAARTGQDVPADGAGAKRRSVSRDGADRSVSEHARSCRTIGPISSFFDGHSNIGHLPLNVHPLGNTTYGQAFANFATARAGSGRVRIWHGVMPFKQRPEWRDGLLRIEVFGDRTDRKAVVLEGRGLDEIARDRILGRLGQTLDASERSWRDHRRECAKLFAFAPEPQPGADFYVDSPAKLCFLFSVR